MTTFICLKTTTENGEANEPIHFILVIIIRFLDDYVLIRIKKRNCDSKTKETGVKLSFVRQPQNNGIYL